MDHQYARLPVGRSVWRALFGIAAVALLLDSGPVIQASQTHQKVKTFLPDGTLPYLTRAASVPTYRVVGNRAEDIPSFETNAIVPIVDWRQLRPWEIKEGGVSPGTVVKLAEVSAWNRNRPYILGSLLVALIETGLVAWLLVERRRRKRSQRLLVRRFAIEKVISECSTRLSDCTAEQVGTEITHGLQALLEAEKIDRASWFVIPEPGLAVRDTWTVHRRGVVSDPALSRLAALPWTMQRLLQGERVAVNKLEELPPEAAADKLYLEQNWIKSAALVPSGSGTAMKSALTLVCLSTERAWPQTLLDRLGVLSNVFANATMRKQAQEAKQQSEQRFRYLFEEAPFGIAIEDIDGQLLFANPALASMLGYTADELCGTKCVEFANDEDEKDDWVHFREMRAGLRQSYQIEKRYTRKDGNRVWGRLNVSLLKGSAQWPPMVLATVEDITEKKSREEELRLVHGEVRHLTARLLQAQEEERQRIARELHDDIGQRLSMVRIWLDLFAAQLPAGSATNWIDLDNSMDEVDSIITDVHNLSHRLHSSKLEQLGLNTALKEICQRMGEQHQIDVQFRPAENLTSLQPDLALSFYRVAQEALTNAARHSKSARAEVSIVQSTNFLRMVIQDFGMGFDTASHAEGLGLVTMEERLRAIGGKLFVISRKDQGTQIVAEAPLNEGLRPQVA